MEKIIDCGCDILLTSGQKEKAIEGADLIYQLNQKANGRIEIMAGSGITDKNIREIANKTGISSFHSSAKKVIAGNKIMADADMISKMKKLIRVN